jgi:hypothetical protein
MAQLPVQIAIPSPSYINNPSWYDPSSDPTPCEYFLGESLKVVLTISTELGGKRNHHACLVGNLYMK